MPRILVIEDEPAMGQLIAEALRHHAYEVETTVDGRAGIAAARHARPDLVLLDVVLSDISGLEVLKALRTAPETANTPIVLVTGRANLAGMREGMKLGADDYLPKPFEVGELLALVETRLRKTADLRRDADEKLRTLRSHISMIMPQGLLNPLTGIIGLADILREEAASLKPADAAELGRDIQRSSERLHRLIRNFLIYSQIELLAIDPARLEALRRGPPCQFGKVLADTAERVADGHRRRADLQLENKNVEVAVSDQNLGKICEELLDNAFKYSAPGRPVSVSTKLRGRHLWLTIADKGQGIAPETLASLRGKDQFERLFYEQRTSGLGLAIAMRLAELHHGRVVVQSQPGEGTSVLVELPLAVSQPGA